MDPDQDDFHPKNSSNVACAVVDLQTKQLKPLLTYDSTGTPGVNRTENRALFDVLMHGGGCTGRLLVVGTRLSGKTPTVSKPDNKKLHGCGGSAFVVALPENGSVHGINAKVAALLLSARHICTNNRSFNQYDPTDIYYTPEPTANFDTFNVREPEHYLGGRLYKCQIVQYVVDKHTTSSKNMSSHEVIGDAVVLAALLPPVNEEILKDVLHADERSLDDTCLRIGTQILIPSLMSFVPETQKDETNQLAAVGYPSGEQLCIPQADATDFLIQFPKNPLRFHLLESYFHRGERCVASLGGFAGPHDIDTVADNNGFAATTSTGAGMSGGPTLELFGKGLFNGITIGSATSHPLSYLVDELFNVLEKEPYDPVAAEAVRSRFGSDRFKLKFAEDLDFATSPYKRREIVLAICDDAMTHLKLDASENFPQTVDQLNFNHVIPVAGSTISTLYRDTIANYIKRENLNEIQLAAWDSYCSSL